MGQPSSAAPSKVIDAAKNALNIDRIGYTNALGIYPLRQAISSHYMEKYGIHVNPSNIVITTGSSAAFLFAFLGCFDIDDHVAICGTGYPCYRNILSALNLKYQCIPANHEFKLTAKELIDEISERARTGQPRLKGLILSSPGNPTGAMLTATELKDLCKVCDENGITFISDEIYHHISYGTVKESTALEHSKGVIIINSFSKYYSMTGWRLGWMIVPDSLVDTINRLSQNFYINAPTLSQLAAVEAFNCEDELQSHILKYSKNREIVLAALKDLGFSSSAISPADGAFYVYVDIKEALESKNKSWDAPTICRKVLEEAGVAITPGVDFEDPLSGLGLQRIRFSYSRSTEEVSEGMNRFESWWRRNILSY